MQIPDVKTMSLTDTKLESVLKDKDEKIEGFFIVPLKNLGRALLITTETEARKRQIWNDKFEKAKEIW